MKKRFRSEALVGIVNAMYFELYYIHSYILVYSVSFICMHIATYICHVENIVLKIHIIKLIDLLTLKDS